MFEMNVPLQIIYKTSSVGLWKFIQIPTSHQPMKSNFPGIQFRVLTVYTETGDFEVPYS